VFSPGFTLAPGALPFWHRASFGVQCSYNHHLLLTESTCHEQRLEEACDATTIIIQPANISFPHKPDVALVWG